MDKLEACGTLGRQQESERPRVSRVQDAAGVNGFDGFDDKRLLRVRMIEAESLLGVRDTMLLLVELGRVGTEGRRDGRQRCKQGCRDDRPGCAEGRRQGRPGCKQGRRDRMQRRSEMAAKDTAKDTQKDDVKATKKVAEMAAKDVQSTTSGYQLSK